MAAQEYSNQVGDLDGGVDAQANAWVAEFAPLILDDQSLDTQSLKERIKRIDKLRLESVELRKRLDQAETSVDPELVGTVHKAADQLDSLQKDYRKRLAKLAPGDPLGIPNLDVVQEKLAEREAKQELGVATDQETPAVLEMETSPSNWASASFAGVFGLGWTAFTTLHAVFMIGGMMKAFGPVALLMLLFYAIFFLAGFAMLASAFKAASKESVRLEGFNLSVVQKLGAIVRSKSYVLDPKGHATVGVPQQNANFRQSNTTPSQAVILTTENGSELSLATQTTASQREQICQKINAYLAAQD